ncbi:unnamed protein product [Brachionus calyciflorus]|uniref:Uncharacterized protein n=1 Tax=Brachionus calyciflorus TaxID=104777 RepID=A0A813XGA9_9BILA|nr:unnamed protein product [Brachionus calyciflorus]
MPSKTFQPLLFDSFKYKLPDTTYIDHYGKKHKRKEFNTTVYRTFSGIINQRERMTVMTQRSRPFKTSSFIQTFDKSQNNNSNNPSRNAVNFDKKVVVKEISNRGSSAGSSSITISNLDTNEKNHVKLVSPPPPTPPASSPAKSLVDVPIERIDKIVEKISSITDNNKDSKFDYHWMVFKQEETPSHIIESKKRLGQIKEPNVIPGQAKEKQVKIPEKEINNLKIEDRIEPVKAVNKHWIQWDNPKTPDNIAEIRRRLGDDRYRKNNTLYNVSRSQTISSFDRSKPDLSKENETKEPTQVLASNEDSQKQEVSLIETKLDENGAKYYVSYEPKTEYVQTSFKTNLPFYQIAKTFNYFDKENNELVENYFDATANYLNNEAISEPKNYILPSNENEQASNEKNTQDSKSVPFQTWLKTANDQDREAVLKILSDIESDKSKSNQMNQLETRVSSRVSNNQQMNNYVKLKSKNVTQHPHQQQTQILLKKRPSTSNSVRKLGVTRNKYNAPIDENLEKILLKHTLWSNEINGPATVHFGYNV